LHAGWNRYEKPLNAGFKTEELKAQVDTSKNLKVSGEHNIEGNKWCRFHKSFQLPKECEISKIQANFDNGVLYVMVPKPSVMNQSSNQNNNTTTTSTGEQQSNESKGKPLKENEEPVQGVVRNLLKQKLVNTKCCYCCHTLGTCSFQKIQFS
jgi:Hsp20/alpha crystallin family